MHKTVGIYFLHALPCDSCLQVLAAVVQPSEYEVQTLRLHLQRSLPTHFVHV